MSFHYNFDKKDLLIYKNKPYRWLDQTEQGFRFASDDELEQVITIRHEKMLDLLDNPEVRVERGYFGRSRAAVRRNSETEFLADLPAKKRHKALSDCEMARFGQELIRKGEMTLSDASMEAAQPELVRNMATWAAEQQIEEKARDKTRNVGAEQKDKARKGKDARQTVTQFRIPSVKTWRKLIKIGVQCGFDARAFVPRHKVKGRKAQSRLAMEAMVIMQEEVVKYASNLRPTKKKIVENVRDAIDERNKRREAEGLEPLAKPSERTIYRRIDALDAYAVTCARYGVGVANRKFALNMSGIQVRFPMDRLEIDDWKLDLFSLAISSGRAKDMTPEQLNAIKKLRLWAVVVIDCATRCVVGLTVTRNPGVEAALRAMEMTTMDKSECAAFHGATGHWNQAGLARTVASDNGGWFISSAFQGPVTDMGAGLLNTVAGVPMLRAQVERVFGTWSTTLMEELPGRTFSNYVAKGDYDAKGNACLTEDEITGILVRFVVDVYHNLPHEGLGGETPARAWDRLTSTYGVDLPPDGYARRAAFGLPGKRRIGNQGITLFGVEYTSPLVQSIFLSEGKVDVSVRVDPKDLGWIAMSWDGKWHPIKAKLDFLDKVHLTDWIATETAMRKRFRDEAELDREMVREALADIRATVAAAAARLDIGPSRMNEAAVQRAHDSLFVGMPIGDQLAVEGLESVSPAVNILSDERTDQLLEKDPHPPVASEPQINDHNADDEGGEEPEIL